LLFFGLAGVLAYSEHAGVCPHGITDEARLGELVADLYHYADGLVSLAGLLGDALMELSATVNTLPCASADQPSAVRSTAVPEPRSGTADRMARRRPNKRNMTL
jgi:hypothetical protein